MKRKTAQFRPKKRKEVRNHATEEKKILPLAVLTERKSTVDLAVITAARTEVVPEIPPLLSFPKFLLLQREKIKLAEERTDRSQPIDRICEGCPNFNPETRECKGIGRSCIGIHDDSSFCHKPQYPESPLCPRRWQFVFHDHDIVQDDDWIEWQKEMWEYFKLLTCFVKGINGPKRNRLFPMKCPAPAVNTELLSQKETIPDVPPVISFDDYVLWQKKKIKLAEERTDRSQPIDRICDGCSNFDSEIHECKGISCIYICCKWGQGPKRSRPSYPLPYALDCFCPRRWQFAYHADDIPEEEEFVKRMTGWWDYIMDYRCHLDGTWRCGTRFFDKFVSAWEMQGNHKK